MISWRYAQAVSNLRRDREGTGLHPGRIAQRAGPRQGAPPALGKGRRFRAPGRGAPRTRASREPEHARLRTPLSSHPEDRGLDGRAAGGRGRELMAWVVDTCILIDVLEDYPQFG